MDFKTVYSNRTTVSISVGKDAGITVRAPRHIDRRQLEEFVARNLDWIHKTQKKVLEKQHMLDSIDSDEQNELRRRAQEYIPAKARQFADMMGVEYTDIKITAAKTRFGSCSAVNSLCFSLYLMCYPVSAVDAVIVHELAHIREKNHSPRFYRIVEETLPDYKQRKKLLKNGIL